jgi:hypothetical protein
LRFIGIIHNIYEIITITLILAEYILSIQGKSEKI